MSRQLSLKKRLQKELLEMYSLNSILWEKNAEKGYHVSDLRRAIKLLVLEPNCLESLLIKDFVEILLQEESKYISQFQNSSGCSAAIPNMLF
jgi:hypothetical protein